MKKKVVLIGYSGHSYVVADVLKSISDYSISGYLDIEEKINNPISIEYLGNNNNIQKIENTFYFPTIGNNNARKLIIEKLNSKNILPFSITSLYSNISDLAKIGEYCFIARNSIINSLTSIGDGCIINTGAIVEHECKISNYVHVGPGAVLSGNVIVNELTFIGANAVVKQGITIGKNVTVGAGSTVIEDIPDNEIWAGNPAKRIKSKSVRKIHEIQNKYVLTTEDYLHWNELINLLPSEKRDVYFTAKYHKIQELENYGNAECFVYKRGNEFVIFPYLKNKIESTFELSDEYFDIESVYGYTGPVSNSTNEKFLADFKLEFEKHCIENNIVCGFIRYHFLTNNEKNNVFFKNNLLDRETVYVDTNQSIYDIWDSEISSKNRNIIRKAKLNNLSIQIISNPTDEEIMFFVETYHQTMKILNADDYYFFSLDYLKNTFKILHKKTYLFNVLNKEGKIMCTSMFFHFGEYFHYHLSARTEYADNTSNNYLLYKAIQFAQDLNAKYFHLGGGRTKMEDDSLLKFKQSFSTQRAKFHISKEIFIPNVYNQIINKWNSLNPEKAEKLKHLLLRYKL